MGKTDSADVPDQGPSHSVLVKSASTEQTPKGLRSTEKCEHLSGSSRRVVRAVRKDNSLPKLLQLSTTPTLNTSTPFSFTRRDALRPPPHSIRIAHPTHPLKDSPTFIPIIDCGRLGDYKEQRDSWTSLSHLKNCWCCRRPPDSRGLEGRDASSNRRAGECGERTF